MRSFILALLIVSAWHFSLPLRAAGFEDYYGVYEGDYRDQKMFIEVESAEGSVFPGELSLRFYGQSGYGSQSNIDFGAPVRHWIPVSGTRGYTLYDTYVRTGLTSFTGTQSWSRFGFRIPQVVREYRFETLESGEKQLSISDRSVRRIFFYSWKSKARLCQFLLTEKPSKDSTGP